MTPNTKVIKVIPVTANPYPGKIHDDCTGLEFTNDEYIAWNLGYNHRSWEVEIAMQKCKELSELLEVELKRLKQPVRNIN